jgi:hypothetical protein
VQVRRPRASSNADHLSTASLSTSALILARFACIFAEMEQYILQLKDARKKKFFDELLSQLDFIEVVNILKDGKKATVALELMEALGDAKAHLRGTKKLRPAKRLLDEL